VWKHSSVERILLVLRVLKLFFDRLYEDNNLYAFDLLLREKVIEKFCTIKEHETLKLFYNIDSRISKMEDFSKGNTHQLLKRYNLDQKMVVFEFSEQNGVDDIIEFTQLMHHYDNEGFCAAIDDFGVGPSGYKLLYHCAPNIIKIDRFFLHGIDKDSKKKLLARNMVQLATLLGCRIIAEGVESTHELLVCKEIGCHMAQGYFIQHPTIDCSLIVKKYFTDNLLVEDKRSAGSKKIILKRLIPLEPIMVNDSMETLFELLNKKGVYLVPVLDQSMNPLGIIHEHKLKSIAYSPYGRSLTQNRTSNFSALETYVEPIPVVDVTTPLETMLELFSLSENAPGVLIVESSRYVGYLSAREMIEVVHERNLIRARDENPLTRLPGNFIINEYIASVIETGSEAVLAYFDFDHFKPYNDHYGFRNGDRVILLFAELMHKILCIEYFKGHIGGDDFFVGALLDETQTFEKVCSQLELLIATFSDEVRAFYEPADRERGCIVAEDREGNRREFKLLGVSAVVIRMGAGSSIESSEHLQRTFAMEKKMAKKSPTHMSIIGY
jgi:EAL domain-containing protein (putative c-di-GMP-specific phosphodiesterase class I)/GGDEF domain-containing protein